MPTLTIPIYFFFLFSLCISISPNTYMDNRHHHREFTFLSSAHFLDHIDPPSIKEMDFFSTSSPRDHKNNTSSRDTNDDHYQNRDDQHDTHDRHGSPTRVIDHRVNVRFQIWICQILHHCVLNATDFFFKKIF